MIKYTSTPIKVSGFFLLISIFFSCTKDSDLLSDYVLQDSIGEIEQTNTDQSETPEDPGSDQNDNPNDPFVNRTIEVDFYVTASGSASNDGLTEATAWSIQHAFATAKAGDVVGIKAGSYETSTLYTSSAGTLENPIKFIGYLSTPGDIVSNGSPTYTKAMFDADGTVMDGTDMPLLWFDRGPDDNPIGVHGISILHSYIHLENIKLQYYERAVDVTNGSLVGMTFKNVICNELGNWDQTSPGWDKPFSGANISGQGWYTVDLNDSKWIDCSVFNAGAAAYFPVRGNNLLFDGCEAYSTKTGNASDYLFDFARITNSTLRNYIAYRENLDTSKMHTSRAVMLQLWSSGNLIENGTHVNVRTQLEMFSTNNTLKNIRVIGSGTANQGNLQISGESNNNLFLNWHMTDTEGIQFLGASDARSPGNDPAYSGNNNYFVNFKIENVPAGNGNAIFSYHRLSFSQSDPGGTNFVIGLTADNAYALVNTNRPGTLHVYNSSFTNVAAFDVFSTSNGASDHPVTVNFKNCDFYNNGFAAPSGTGITAGNPLLDGDLIPDDIGA